MTFARSSGSTLALGLLAAVVAGAVTARMPALAGVGVIGCVVALAALALGERSLPWILVGAAVIPYFDRAAGFEVPSVVPRPVLLGLTVSAAVVPLLYAMVFKRRESQLRSWELLLLGLLGVLGAVSAARLGVDGMADMVPVAFFAGAVAYLAGRRFPRAEDWGLPCAAGLGFLLAFGASVYLQAPDDRLGYFSGYPILYGALLVTLLPGALLWAYRQSPYLAAGLAGVTAAALVASETRSAWIALIVMGIAGLVVAARLGRMRAVGLILASVLIVAAVVATSETLRTTVSERLSPEELTGEALTHRQSIYGYTSNQVSANPVLGLGGPGAAKDELRSSTGIDASDNGYLALAADLGVLGLLVGLIPAVAAAVALVRLPRAGEVSAGRLALALGLLALLVVNLFFDVYYWPQSSLLAFGMAGVLMAPRGAREGPPA